MEKRSKPIAACHDCGLTTHRPESINGNHQNPITRKKCKGTFTSASLGELDWEECPSCNATGIIDGKSCDQCNRDGWLFIRKRY